MKRFFIFLLCMVCAMTSLVAMGGKPQKEADTVDVVSHSKVRVVDRGVRFAGLRQVDVSRLPKQHQQWLVDSPEMQEYVSQFFGYVLPSVDFEKQVVLFLFQGVKPTGGYAIRIREVDEQKDRVLVHVVLEEPGEGCSVIQSLTTPYEVGVMRKVDKRVLFIPRIETKDCR